MEDKENKEEIKQKPQRDDDYWYEHLIVERELFPKRNEDIKTPY